MRSAPSFSTGDHGHFARSRAVCIRADAQHHRLARGLLEEAVEIGGRTHVAAVHRQQIFARSDVDARLRERRVQLRVPIFAAVHFGEAVSAVFNFVVGAEQAALHALHLRERAAAHKEVPDRKFAEHLLEQIVQIAAAGDRFQIGLILLLGGFPVQSMQSRDRRKSRARCARLRGTSASTRRADRCALPCRPVSARPSPGLGGCTAAEITQLGPCWYSIFSPSPGSHKTPQIFEDLVGLPRFQLELVERGGFSLVRAAPRDFALSQSETGCPSCRRPARCNRAPESAARGFSDRCPARSILTSEFLDSEFLPRLLTS